MSITRYKIAFNNSWKKAQYKIVYLSKPIRVHVWTTYTGEQAFSFKTRRAALSNARTLQTLGYTGVTILKETKK